VLVDISSEKLNQLRQISVKLGSYLVFFATLFQKSGICSTLRDINVHANIVEDRSIG